MFLSVDVIVWASQKLPSMYCLHRCHDVAFFLSPSPLPFLPPSRSHAPTLPRSHPPSLLPFLPFLPFLLFLPFLPSLPFLLCLSLSLFFFLVSSVSGYPPAGTLVLFVVFFGLFFNYRHIFPYACLHSNHRLTRKSRPWFMVPHAISLHPVFSLKFKARGFGLSSLEFGLLMLMSLVYEAQNMYERLS